MRRRWHVVLKCKKDVMILLNSARRDVTASERVRRSIALSEPMAFSHGNHEFTLESTWTHETYYWDGGGENTHDGFLAFVELPEGEDLAVTPITGWQFKRTFNPSDEGTWWLDPVEGWKKED